MRLISLLSIALIVLLLGTLLMLYFYAQKYISFKNSGTVEHVVKLDKGVLPSEKTHIDFWSWNIYKTQSSGWDTQLQSMLQTADIITLQEATLTNNFSQFLATHAAHTLFDVLHLNAFNTGTQRNGVMTLSRFPVLEYSAQTYQEPWIRFPKSALITYLDIKHDTPQSAQLLVINLHAVNFTLGVDDFEKQLNPLFKIIKNHQGPIILAGDFNTWSMARAELLTKMTEQFGLSPVNFEPDFRMTILNKPLDHIFIRGLTVDESSVIKTLSSDHNPLHVRFKI